MDRRELEEQAQALIEKLEKKGDLSGNVDTMKQAVTWLQSISGRSLSPPLRSRLFNQISQSFGISLSELNSRVYGVSAVVQDRVKTEEEELESLLPNSGWFKNYVEYTRSTESPLSFHVYSSMCIIAAALGRRVTFKMGILEPIIMNYPCVLVGTTGLVKKTSAVNVVKGFIRNLALCPIFAEQITPQALGVALARDGGHQFFYVPELAFLFNKQKFNEGLSTNMLRILDSPSELEIETVVRGRQIVDGISVTFLGGSAAELLVDSVPRELLSHGFINRFIWIYEEDTDRVVPIPEDPSEVYRTRITEDIERIKGVSGEASFSSKARVVFEDWYRDRKVYLRKIGPEMASAVQRGDTFLIRFATYLSLLYQDSLVINERELGYAISLLNFAEKRMPNLVRVLKNATVSREQDSIVRVLERNGGLLDHSSLLRVVSFSTERLKAITKTMEESGIIEISSVGKSTLYTLRRNYDD